MGKRVVCLTTFLVAIGCAVAFVAVLGVATQRASATVMDYHAFVQSYGDTLVQYDFDGSTNAERREDKKGSNDLVEKITTTSTYDPGGFDASSRAVDGGFLTSSAISPSAIAMSFEAVVSPTEKLSGYLAASLDGTNRGYFGVVKTAKLAAVAGDSYGNEAVIVSPFDVGDWYYCAVTMSYDSPSTTINTYVANLSDGATILTHASTDVSWDGTFQTAIPTGIGLLNGNGNPQSPFYGTIDEIAFYSGVMDLAFFQANLDRILAVPEPSSLLLLFSAIGILGLTIRRQRWRRVNTK